MAVFRRRRVRDCLHPPSFPEKAGETKRHPSRGFRARCQALGIGIMIILGQMKRAWPAGKEFGPGRRGRGEGKGREGKGRGTATAGRQIPHVECPYLAQRQGP